jgi:hypothetical protein
MSSEYDHDDDGHESTDTDQGHDTTHDDDSGCGRHSECADCDPDLIDDLACQAEGIQAQADYNKQTQEELKKASDDYTTARSAYRAARAAAAAEVQDLRHQVKQLVERIRCQIKQDRVVDCLDEAFEHICHRLKKCGVGGGCCSTDDCDYDKTCPDSYAELVSRIAEYQDRLAHEKSCFNALIGEAQALTQRVADAKQEIDDIDAALKGDPATLDLKRQYAAALVAQRHLKWDMIWNGFKHTQDYIDCLCRALTCWTKANDAISVLTGCQAVMDCQKKAREKCCDDLRTKTVDEVVLEYERICGSERCKDDDAASDESCDDSDEDDKDKDDGSHEDDEGDDAPCGCDHGHDHRHGHHRHAHRHDSAD